jgi:single-stranded DNA-binding protein
MKKLQIIGNIAKDAEKKETKGGKNFLSFSVAINENYKDPSGEWVDKT